jgi:hypothetical protein
VIPETYRRKSAQSVDDPTVYPQISQISADLDSGLHLPLNLSAQIGATGG